MSDSLSVSHVRNRIERIVQRYVTDEAKQQLQAEKSWRKGNERNNQRREKKQRKPISEQIPILARLTTEGLEELWKLVKDNKKIVYLNEYCRRHNTPCWEWKAEVGKKGSKNRLPYTRKQGYGYVSLLGLGKTSLMVTHLALWTRMHSLKPTRRDVVSHRCHNPICFNPDHLCQEHHLLNSGRNGCSAFRDAECLVSDCIHGPHFCIAAHSSNPDRVPDQSTVASTGTADNSNPTTTSARKRKREEDTEEEEVESSDEEEEKVAVREEIVISDDD